MLNIWEPLGTGAIVGFILLIFFVFFGRSKYPLKNESFTPVFACMSENDFFSYPPETYVYFTGLEDRLSIQMPLASEKVMYNIMYDKILKFDFIEEFSLDNKTYPQYKKEGTPNRIILEYIDDNNSIQRVIFMQNRANEALNQKPLWINNIFDYVKARTNINK